MVLSSRLQRQVALLQLADRVRSQQRVGARQPLGVGALARLDHVLEGDHAVAPAIQGAAHEHQVAVVLQALLEVMPGEQRVQVAGLGRIRQVLQLPEPAIARVLVLDQHALQQVALVDAGDGLIQPPVLGIEGAHRALVVLGRLGVGVQLGKRVGHGQVGFLHRRIEHVALAQLQPGCERALVVPERGIRPADAEQRLVGVRPVEAHARQRRARPGGLVRPAGKQTRARDWRGHAAPPAPGVSASIEPTLGQERVRVAQPLLPHQRHAEIEARIRRPHRPAAPSRQQADRLVETSLVHQHVAEQQLLLRLQIGRHASVDLAQRRIGPVEIAARIPDLRQVKPGPVAHPGGHIERQQPLEALARLVVHAERRDTARRSAAAPRPCGAACAASGRRRAGASAPRSHRSGSNKRARRRSAGRGCASPAASPDRGGAHRPRPRPAAPGRQGTARACDGPRLIPSP